VRNSSIFERLGAALDADGCETRLDQLG